jgi:2-polyprenyl-3-methyl-5-hydroxy-6-metoxy-1,4-benzoquinol methylase
MTYSYQGSELDLFQHAVNWKRYYARRLRPYIAGDVLEVGAGIGATSRFLCHERLTSWTCLEPDAALVARLKAVLEREPLSVPSTVWQGTLADLPAEERFDTILYIDVLEHIEGDDAELRQSADRLRPGGKVIVLAPAHGWLFSRFDSAIGHHRRYSAEMLARITPPPLHLAAAFYLDSVGMLASLANRLLLREAYPTLSQIRFWDSTLVRLSRVLDPCGLYRVGKTVIGVYTSAPTGPA